MKKKNIMIIVCIIFLIYCIGGIIYNFMDLGDRNKNKNNKVDNSIQIKGFDYICNEEQILLYKNEFNVLKKNLESSNINYIEYAHSVTKLFLVDLYTLKNKKNMYDVGGLQFIYPDSRENYKLNVINTLYKYMEDNSDGKRKQVLPEVSDINIISDEEIEFKIGEDIFEGYKLEVDISYVEDLEYDKKAEVILVKMDKYLYIVEKN